MAARRLEVVLLATIALLLVSSGCLGDPGPRGAVATPDPPIESLPTESCPTADTVEALQSPLEPRELPSRPPTFDNSSAVAFAEAFEQAYKWNSDLRNVTSEMTIDVVESRILERTRTGYVVHFEAGTSVTENRDGQRSAGSGYYTVNYFVNESVIVRSSAGGERDPGPDVANGTRVLC